MTFRRSTTADRRSRTAALLAGLAGGGLLLSGCTTPTPEAEPTVTVTESASPSASSSSSTKAAAGDGKPFGAGCSSLPNNGEVPKDASLADVLGQFPQLSAFASAVDGSDVQKQIDEAGDVTVFAPTDTAFTALISSDPRLLLKPAELGKVLQYHVVQQPLAESDLPGSFKTLEGSEVSVTGADGTFVVNGETAITCGGIKAGNVTLNVVSAVLSPPS